MSTWDDERVHLPFSKVNISGIKIINIFYTTYADLIRLQCIGWIRIQETKFGTADNTEGERM